MLNKKKRSLIIISSIFALFLSIVLFAVNFLAIIGKFTSLDYSNIAPLRILQDCIDKYDYPAMNRLHFLIYTGALAFFGLLLFIVAISNLKKSYNSKGEVKKKSFALFLQILFSLICLAGGIYFTIDSTALFKTAENYSIVTYILYAYAGLGFLTFIFAIFSMFCCDKKKEKVITKKMQIDEKVDRVFNGKKETPIPVVKCKTTAINKIGDEIINVDSSNIEPIVKVIEDKIVKINQLKNLGIISEAQYNAAIARLLNSI